MYISTCGILMKTQGNERSTLQAMTCYKEPDSTCNLLQSSAAHTFWFHHTDIPSPIISETHDGLSPLKAAAKI